MITQQFLDTTLTPVANKKVTLTPVRPPVTDGNYLAVGDPKVLTTDANGYISGSLVDATYSVTIPTNPETDFYALVSGSTFTPISSSVKTGLAPCVFVNLEDILTNYFDVKKVTITPETNYPWSFSGSVISMGGCNRTTDATGSVHYEHLVPGIHQVEAFGKVVTTWYISVPNTLSGSSCWNMKDLMVVKPTQGLKVKVNDADKSFVLTVSSSDQRYLRSDVTQSHSISSSYAVSASYAPSSGGADLWTEIIPATLIDYEGSITHGATNTATGDYSHAEGLNTNASGSYSHAEGLNTLTKGIYSHAEGIGTIASGSGQHVQGKYNIPNTSSLLIVGNGVDASHRSNVLLVNTSSVEISSSLNVRNPVTASYKYYSSAYRDFTGGVGGMWIGASNDGITYTNIGSTPAVHTGSFGTRDPHLLHWRNTWYVVYGDSTTPPTASAHIKIAQSNDLLSWTEIVNLPLGSYLGAINVCHWVQDYSGVHIVVNIDNVRDYVEIHPTSDNWNTASNWSKPIALRDIHGEIIGPPQPPSPLGHGNSYLAYKDNTYYMVFNTANDTGTIKIRTSANLTTDWSDSSLVSFAQHTASLQREALSLIVGNNNVLRAHIGSGNSGAYKIYFIDSYDNGLTWTTPQLITFNSFPNGFNWSEFYADKLTDTTGIEFSNQLTNNRYLLSDGENINVRGKLAVNGHTVLDGNNLSVVKNISFSGSLKNDGITLFDGQSFFAPKDINFSGSLINSGTTVYDGHDLFAGNLTLTQSLNVTNDINFSGSLIHNGTPLDISYQSPIASEDDSTAFYSTGSLPQFDGVGLVFTGSESQFASNTDFTVGSGSFTCAFLVTPLHDVDFSEFWGTILGQQDPNTISWPDPNYNNWFVWLSQDGYVHFSVKRLYGDFGFGDYSGNPGVYVQITQGVENLVIAQYNTSTQEMKIYCSALDEWSSGSNAIPWTGSATNNFRIGCGNPLDAPNNPFFDGEVNKVKVWKSYLDSTDLDSLIADYNSPISVEPDIDVLEDGTTNDLSGNGYNLTLNYDRIDEPFIFNSSSLNETAYNQNIYQNYGKVIVLPITSAIGQVVSYTTAQDMYGVSVVSGSVILSDTPLTEIYSNETATWKAINNYGDWVRQVERLNDSYSSHVDFTNPTNTYSGTFTGTISNATSASYVSGSTIVVTNIRGASGNNTGSIQFFAGSATSRLNISSSGAISMGGATPTNLNRLTITGNVAASAFSSSNFASSVLLGNISLNTSGSTRLFVSGSGKIGIGTIIPINKLDVVGNISCSVITASLFGNADTATSASFATTAISASYTLSASYATSASYSNVAISASYLSGSNRGYPLPIIQASSSLVTAATTQIFTFTQAMPNTNYTLTIGSDTAITSPTWSGKTVGGFTASFGLYTGTIDWQAIGIN